MNKRVALPCAALLAAMHGHACAQAASNVAIYGILDAGVEVQKASAGSAGPATTRKQLLGGTFSASRLGFRGSEDLGDGLRAFFQIEHGLNSDDGSVTGAAFWGRKAIVGVGGRWGELSLGRDYTPGFWVQFYTDVNTFAMYGNSGTMSAFALTGMLRANNGVSKKTNLYIGAGRVSNNESAQFGLEGGSRAIPNNGRGSDTTAVGAGIRTTF